MKKMMAFVFGILCAMCLAPMAITATQVHAESITDPLVVKVETYATGTNTFQAQVKIVQNTGFCGLQFKINSSSSVFKTTSVSGNDIAHVKYVGDKTTGIYSWASDGSSVNNVTSTGTILYVNMELKSSATDGEYTISLSNIVACYYQGTSTVDKTVAPQSAKVKITNGQLEGMENLQTGLPTWAIIAIVIGGVAIVGGIITLVVVNSKKQPTSWKQVK